MARGAASLEWGTWRQVTSATTASNGSRLASHTIAGRLPRPRSRRTCRKISQDAWARLRETALEFGEQRVYASHSSIMFSRRACYFFVRPKKKMLEVCFFLGRAVKSPLGTSGDAGVTGQGRAHRAPDASRSGRSTDHRLVAGGLRRHRHAPRQNEEKGANRAQEGRPPRQASA